MPAATATAEPEDDPPQTGPPDDVDNQIVPAMGHGVHHEPLVDVEALGDEVPSHDQARTVPNTDARR